MIHLPLGLVLAFAVLQTGPSESEAALQNGPTGFAAELQTNVDLVGELAAMGARDQYARRLLHRWWEANGLSEAELEHYHGSMWQDVSRIDDTNEVRLKEILASRSWRQLAELGPEAYEAAWLIVQHSPDVEFQGQALSEIEPLAREGMVRGSSYALLYDRVSLGRGDNQLYGSQLRCSDGEWVLAPLDDPEHVEERRAQFGLGPMNEYIARVVEHSPGCSNASE